MSKQKTLVEFSEELDATKVVLIHETVMESYARDLGTFLTFFALWSVGYFYGSSALQWLGVIAGVVVTFSRAIRFLKGSMKSKMTPNEARKWLDENFPNEAK